MSSEKSRATQIWEAFRDLSIPQKFGAITVVAVVVYILISLVVSALPGTQAEDEELPDEPPYSTQPIEPGQADPSAQPTASSDPEDPAKEEFPIVDGKPLPTLSSDNPLPVKDQRAALEAAENGVDEFLDWDPKETAKERTKRVTPFFTEDSSAKDLDPLLGNTNAENVDAETGLPIVAYMGETNSVVPGLGDANRYRTSVGVELRSQMFDSGTKEAASPVETKALLYTVDLTKDDGAWKIISIVAE